MELWNTVGHLDVPAGMVEEPVVSAAERYTVLQAGRAVINPVNDVVYVAPASRY
jgi:hypothetical protein